MLETITLVNRRRRHSRRRNPIGLGSLNSMWNEGTAHMTVPALAGGLIGGWAATGVPAMTGWSAGYQGLLAAGITAVGGTILIGKLISKEAAMGYGIVAGTLVVNRVLKTVVGMGVPYLSDGISGITNALGISNTGWFRGDEEEIFGVESMGNVGVLEPTYSGWGTY